MIVYKIWNDINNKLYIGITIRTLNERWIEHKSRMQERIHCHLYAAMNKYGIEHFHIQQIDEASTKEELYKKEQYYIAYYKTQDPEYGYNMTSGGDALKAIDLDKEKIVYLYNNKRMSYAEISDIFGVSESTIRRRLIKNGIKPNWSCACKITEEDDKNIIDLRKQNISVSRIADMYGVSKSTIRRHLYKYNMN